MKRLLIAASAVAMLALTFLWGRQTALEECRAAKDACARVKSDAMRLGIKVDDTDREIKTLLKACRLYWEPGQGSVSE